MGYYYQRNQATILIIRRVRLGNRQRWLLVDAKIKSTGRIVSFEWTEVPTVEKNDRSKLLFEDFDAFWKDDRAKGKNAWLYCTLDLQHVFMRLKK